MRLNISVGFIYPEESTIVSVEDDEGSLYKRRPFASLRVNVLYMLKSILGHI